MCVSVSLSLALSLYMCVCVCAHISLSPIHINSSVCHTYMLKTRRTATIAARHVGHSFTVESILLSVHNISVYYT